MKIVRLSGTVLSAVLLTLTFASPGSAQATRTWVSGVGDDVNPCSRTAPCKTFAGAISKTAAGGEINCLDPGGYGAVTITKAITLDCGGTFGSILASGTNGIIVNANAASDTIIIRNISIQGAGTGINGIRYLAAKAVHLEHVNIMNFTTDGVELNATATANLTIHDVMIMNCGTAGISLATSSGNAVADINQAWITNANQGIRTLSGNTIVNIRNSNISVNPFGVIQTSGGSQINLVNNQLSSNGTAVQSSSGSMIMIVGNTFGQNSTAVNANGGVISTDSQNSTAGNASNGFTNGTVTKI
jgi:hypothetical protein